MYVGWMQLNYNEVINSHRAVAYAQAAGFHTVYGCSQCDTVDAVNNLLGRYQTPYLDAISGLLNVDIVPPWWPVQGSIEQKSDASNFLGVLGVQVDGAEDSMRDIKVTEGISSGGYLGPLRYKSRELTFRVALLGANDCGLNYGIEWLGNLDSADSCEGSQIQMFACCPHAHAEDCENHNCAVECFGHYQRSFHNIRITSGPEVLRRIEMQGVGYVAEVEFIVTCGDPNIYSFNINPQPGEVESVPVEDDPPEDPPPPLVDEFDTPPTVPDPPEEPTLPVTTRTQWLRQQIDVAGPASGREAYPVIVVESDEAVPELRLTVLGETGSDRYYMQGFPAGGGVTIDFAARTVTTKSNGHEAVRNWYVTDSFGKPMAWPDPLDAGGYTVLLDRPLDTAPLRLGASSIGLVMA